MLSALAKFFIGFFAGIILLVTGSAVIAYFFLTTFSIAPPKPIFAEEQLKQKPATSVTKSKKATTVTKTKSKPESKSAPSPTPSATPTPKPEPGLYKARITWNQGLSLRDNPSTDSNRIGGVGYNEKVVVLEESSDKKWLRVSLGDGTQKGWIKAGNAEKINSEDEDKPNEQKQQ